MSWIIGYVGTSLSRATRERLAGFGAHPIVHHAGGTFYVACGGVEETCLHGSLPDKRGRWAVVGTGVRVEDGGCRLLTASDWRRRMDARRPRLEQLGGGFVALRWTTRRVEAFSDAFGLRTLYWMRAKGGFHFSTRTDWLASLAGGLSIDWRSFGSHWLAYNQLSPRSLFDGVERLGPSGHVHLTPSGVEATASPYEPARSEEPIDSLLTSLLHPDDDRTLSLGMSGGMDSRVLLASAPRSSRLALHVFGPASREDVKVALGIAEAESLSCSHFHARPPDADALLEVIRTHVVEALAVSPASSAASLRYYPELRAQRKLVVDGGFGEVLRRRFMNRLLRQGARAVEACDAVKALPYVTFDRAPIFTPDCVHEMTFGARRDLALQLDALSELGHLEMEDRIDVLNVWTRLPNFFGYEQARLDGLVQSYMPFAHPRVLDAIFSLPPARRRGGRAARRIISRRAPRLKKHPLVKGGASYPFFLRSAAATMVTSVKRRLAGRGRPAERDQSLGTLREFVHDRLRTRSVREFEAYDTEALERLIDRYYVDGAGGEELDWWLAFDLLRESVSRGEPVQHGRTPRRSHE